MKYVRWHVILMVEFSPGDNITVNRLYRCWPGGTTGSSCHAMQVFVRHWEVILAGSLCQGNSLTCSGVVWLTYGSLVHSVNETESGRGEIRFTINHYYLRCWSLTCEPKVGGLLNYTGTHDQVSEWDDTSVHSEACGVVIRYCLRLFFFYWGPQFTKKTLGQT